ncbi:stage II sporulation protein E [Shimazuella sp. AN120528]|uniref:stage II sporulation protein E n=1 Tax=Shimazuella soli TaxID=1892854 RepID=UPI001F0E2290|nr:stage II sporulation protein E [Shimazuella soli]MCH5585871.1 stage II sporulation protein E [Shimazuella soli]
MSFIKNIIYRPALLEKGWVKRFSHRIMSMWNFPVLTMGFLLGRATILEALSPFSLAYLAVLFHLGRREWPLVMLSLLLGAATLGPMAAVKMTGFFMVLFIVNKLFQWFGRGSLSSTPFVVLISSTVGHLLEFSLQSNANYSYLFAAIDILLSFILTFIFVQSLPLFTVKKNRLGLKHEEMVCLVILMGSVLTGMIGWQVGDISIVHIASRYMILILALVGGGMLGASMGVVTGLILNLSDTKAIMEISLLAFSGLLAGLFQEGRRIGVAVGFLLGSTILSLYQANNANFWLSLEESMIAILFFFLTKESVFLKLSRLVPGTFENQMAHQEYIRRLRDATAGKVERFTELFYELAGSFREDVSKKRHDDEEQVNQFIGNIMSEACMGCRRFTDCWEKKVVKTYQGMTNLLTLVEANGEGPIPVPPFWAEHCIRPDKVLESCQAQYIYHHERMYWKEKIDESKKVVSDQLSGMAEVMEKLTREIRHEAQVLTVQEDQIHSALETLGVDIQRVDVLNLAEGKVEIEVVMPHVDALDECKKLIAPLLTEIIGEPINVHRKMVQDGVSGAIITLGSAQKFELKTGSANAAKGGAVVSGDSFCSLQLGTGKAAIAISDGMGNGQRAQEESSAALKLLRRLLQAGMHEERAVDSVNSILSLRTMDEMFATIDLALVDLNSGRGRFMKIGSTPGFIKRGKKIIKLAASSPPIGILKEIDIKPIEMQLEPGDIMIMMSDGVYDASRHAMNKEAFMNRILHEIDTKDPQDFADSLLEKVIQHQGAIHDDMTVVVSRVERYAPEWTSIRIPGLRRVDRTAVVGS